MTFLSKEEEEEAAFLPLNSLRHLPLRRRLARVLTFLSLVTRNWDPRALQIACGSSMITAFSTAVCEHGCVEACRSPASSMPESGPGGGSSVSLAERADLFPGAHKEPLWELALERAPYSSRGSVKTAPLQPGQERDGGAVCPVPPVGSTGCSQTGVQARLTTARTLSELDRQNGLGSEAMS